MSEETISAIDALKSASSWLERWAVHVGNCAGGQVCTCGLTLVRYEAETALAAEACSHDGEWPADAKFAFGDKVTTPRAPFWIGTICGWYRNSEGRLGFNVEAEAIPFAIHNYPQSGLSAVPLFDDGRD